jgi:hypothetical protein
MDQHDTSFLDEHKKHWNKIHLGGYQSIQNIGFFHPLESCHSRMKEDDSNPADVGRDVAAVSVAVMNGKSSRKR